MFTVAVLGAGVVGLTTALKILEAGYNVVVIAQLFPGDARDIRYTSNFAGANHSSMAGDDKRQFKLDMDTFDVVWKMSEPGSPTEHLFMRTPIIHYYHDPVTKPDPLADTMPEYRKLYSEELRVGATSGTYFMSVTFDVWRYLPWLYSQVLVRGGRAVRAQVQHINQVLEGAFCEKPDALAVCAGIGARTLGGVEDENVFPIRGQTILIRAPWIKQCMGGKAQPGISTYVIPRPSGDVILGGTWFHDDWYPKPKEDIHEMILEGAIKLVPELAPAEVRGSGRTPTVEDIRPLIIEAGCGLRPGRKGGLRLEKDTVEVPNCKGKQVPIVYNYGHGGQGYQSSWGSAMEAVMLLKEGFEV
ncbi:nucleotide-binding domain-containing protein [Dacryopinax primogenitus]|uniref:Nucleotide-binding domain-containing protein n=1 Tax=Dacryopinax primogenitus (strain DJM 731) TaxID=1858805 RepID=M5G2K5_DACPD|nr:nucleotide-binding domain-containing protein [Dacryopinax primogenitus]EJU04456.1 nucleotide-binding domain-containing protein [Dacryopinax primogenitus]